MNEPQPDRDPSPRREITLYGNPYDLAALVALITGATVLMLYLTCGMGSYCLPLVPIVAGIIGLTSAARADDPKRTRLYSWLGIGAGTLYILLALALALIYVALMIYLAASGEF
jgi:hypothetical protein